MKKFLCLLLALIMLSSMVLTSCDKDSDDDNSSTSSSSSTTPSPTPNPEPTPTPTPTTPDDDDDGKDPVMKFYEWYDKDNGVDVTPVNDDKTLDSDTLNILVIGDSKAADSVNYADKVALDMGYQNVKIGCAYNFYGSTMNEIESSVNGNVNSSKKIYFIYREKNSTRDSLGEYTYVSYNQAISDSLSAADWDVILVSENWYDVIMESTYVAGCFKNIVNKAKTLCPNAKIYYMPQYPNVKSDSEAEYTSIISRVSASTASADLSKFDIMPVATAVENAIEAFPYRSEMTTKIANYVSSLLIVSKVSGKSPSSTVYDENLFATKPNFAIVRESVANAIKTPNSVTQTAIQYVKYASRDTSDMHTGSFGVTISKYEGDKKAAISLTFDDGDVSSAEICAQILKKYKIKATFVIQVNATSFVDNERWVRWYNLANGEYAEYVDIGSHDYTGYQNINGNEETEEVITKLNEATLKGQMKDIVYSYGVLSAISTLTAPVGYCTPGAGAKILNRRLQMMFPIFAADRVGANAHGWKSNHVYANDFTAEDYYYLGSMNLVSKGNSSYSYHASQNGVFDDAIKNYGWIIPLQHGIIPSGDSNKEAHTAAENSEGILGWVDITREALEEYCKKLSEEQATSFWFGTYNDVIKYTYEQKASTASIIYKRADSLAFTVTNDLDERFDYPLTIKLRVPLEWTDNATITVRQGNRILKTSPGIVNNGFDFIYIHGVIPNDAPVYVGKIAK